MLESDKALNQSFLLQGPVPHNRRPVTRIAPFTENWKIRPVYLLALEAMYAPN